MPNDKTIACDVLVIGSGAAGMTMAITAHHVVTNQPRPGHRR
jgi:succinate dehydrogenase/fumarate reductase flavoprotein subunit